MLDNPRNHHSTTYSYVDRAGSDSHCNMHTSFSACVFEGSERAGEVVVVDEVWSASVVYQYAFDHNSLQSTPEPGIDPTT